MSNYGHLFINLEEITMLRYIINAYHAHLALRYARLFADTHYMHTTLRVGYRMASEHHANLVR